MEWEVDKGARRMNLIVTLAEGDDWGVGIWDEYCKIPGGSLVAIPAMLPATIIGVKPRTSPSCATSVSWLTASPSLGHSSRGKR